MKKISLPSGRALTTGLLAASLTLQLYPSQPATAAEPAHAVQTASDSPETTFTATQINQVKKLAQSVMAVATNFATAVEQAQQQKEEDAALYTAWSKVAACEQGGWIGAASAEFPNSLGIRSANWYANGGGADVSPSAQIAVAQRMVNNLGINIPDQNGCQPGGW